MRFIHESIMTRIYVFYLLFLTTLHGQEFTAIKSDSILTKLVDYNFGIAIPLNEKGLVEKFGAPKVTEIDTIINIHTDEKDIHTTYKYDGIFFKVFKIRRTKKEILSSVTLHGNVLQLPFDIKIGMPQNKVLELLKLDFNLRTYEYSIRTELGEENTIYIDFYFKAGTLSKIKWNFYLD